jgi:hypothetical protein
LKEAKAEWLSKLDECKRVKDRELKKVKEE